MENDHTVIFAFSADHAARLTGLSKWQLADWDRAGFFKPEHASDNRRERYSRIYSFQDVVGLRTLSMLRKVHKVPMWHLREVAGELEKHVERPWSETTLYVLKRRVYFDEPSTGNVREVSGGLQYALLPLENIAREMNREVERLRARPPDKIGKIERRRNVAHNAWVVAGTRIPIKAIREFASVGYTPEQIVREYPSLTISDVRAALDHAA